MCLCYVIDNDKNVAEYKYADNVVVMVYCWLEDKKYACMTV